MKRLLAALILLCVLCVPAFALSDAKYLQMKKDHNFAAADKQLNLAYKEAKKIFKKEDLQGFIEDQRDWIASGRDRRAKQFMAEGFSEIEAYTKATIERAEGILAWAYGSHLIDVREIDDAYYDNEDGANLYLSLIDYSGMVFDVSFSGKGKTIKLRGTYDYENKIMNAIEGDMKATLTFIDADTVDVEVNSKFRRAFSVDAEGTYSRHYGK